MDSAEEVEARVGPRASTRLAVIAVLVVGGLWVLLHGFGIIDPEGSITFSLGALTAVVCTVIGFRRWRPSPRWPWFALGGMLVLFLLANVLRLSFGTLGNLTPSRSLLPDLIAIPGYVLAVVGLAGLAGVRLRNADDLDAILDGIIAALGVLMLAWVYLVTPVLTRQQVGLPVQVTFAIYPVLSAFVLAMGARAAFSRGRQTPLSMWLILIAMLFLLVGDTVYAMVDTDLLDVPVHVMDVPYVLALVVFSAAALHPSIRRLGMSRPSDDVEARPGRLLGVAVALFLPIIVLLVGLDSTNTSDRIALGIIAVLLVGVGVFRMWRALRQHAQSQARLAYEATHDSLTGLPNRSFVAEHVARVLHDQLDRSGSMTLLHVDIDRFKLVNDSMGHGTGDELLIAVADRLSQRVRPGDLVGRLGGDEFVVVVAGLTDEDSALDFGERTRLMFKQPFTVRGADITVTASVGIAHQPAQNGVAEELIRDADTAVNHAKSRGGDDVVIFDTSMRERVAERLHLERELRNALARNELFLHFQPKLRLSDRKVVGLEALLRWQHPELGTVRPDKFIAIAEDTGMIVEIGAWVIDQACAELAHLRESFRGTSEICMSVNVSARQLRSDTLMDTIAQALLRHRVPPDALCLELTESILMENLELVSGQLDAIRDCGTRISIDDFGTGYSSLAYLSKLSVDELKIDRSFVMELGEDESAASLIQAVVFIASSLGITSVAEGVETVAQAELVAELGCTEVQGFLFSRPLPPEELNTKLVELGMLPVNHLRAVPATRATTAPRALGTTA
jgi:diguanylate cyclase (GGDEF)-like protein